ncbi:R3H domain-containing protein 2 [Linnemannia gamsii]|uniref:R3H domain-containing protein 2 n=1 Tax=Linnemannia gamsii TaxID=64522 RepID=A0ABQ7KBU2_9FUNG|nr:R3H domain-containing protein 2 [Linnemannia gamsii]
MTTMTNVSFDAAVDAATTAEIEAASASLAARSKLTENKNGIPAQPSSTFSSLPILYRTFKQNPHISQSKTTLKQQHHQQETSTAASLPPCSSSPTSPSSSSSSSTFVEGSLDEVLLTALQNRQDRLFLLKLEREYCSFIDDPSKEVLEFPWLNSYFRMMIHRSAIYYRLARTVDAAQKKIVLSKTENTAIPTLRFQELVEEEEDTPVKSIKVLRRCPPRPVSACEARVATGTAILGVASSAPTQSSPSPWQGPGGQSTGRSDRRGTSGTLEQREAAYAKARARIFDTGEEVEEDKEGEREAHEHSGQQDASSTLEEEPYQSFSGASGTSSTARTLPISTVESLSKLEVGQGHSQGLGHSKARSDTTRRTSTSSTISSSSSSSGTTVTDINARGDFVGSWMMSGGHPGAHSMPHASSGIYDHRGGGVRSTKAYCACGADHGSGGHDITSGPQHNNMHSISITFYTVSRTRITTSSISPITTHNNSSRSRSSLTTTASSPSITTSTTEAVATIVASKTHGGSTASLAQKCNPRSSMPHRLALAESPWSQT